MITHLANRLNIIAPDAVRPAVMETRRAGIETVKTNKPLWALKLARRTRRFKTGA